MANSQQSGRELISKRGCITPRLIRFALDDYTLSNMLTLPSVKCYVLSRIYPKECGSELCNVWLLIVSCPELGLRFESPVLQ